MPPKTIKRAQINETNELLESQLNTALQQRLMPKTQSPSSNANIPTLRATTDARLDAFIGRGIDFDVDSTIIINHSPRTTTDQIVFKFCTENDLLLDPRSIFLNIQCSIKRFDNNNIPINIENPKKKTKYVESFIAENKISARNDSTTKLPIMETIRTKVASQKEYIEGVGVAPSVLFPLTIWKNCTLKIGRNNIEIPNSSKDMYGYQAYITWLLTTKNKAIESHLKRNALFILDTNNDIDQFENVSGLQERYKIAANSRKMTFHVPMFCDGLTNIDDGKYLPNNLPITIELEKNAINFYLTSNNINDRYHLKIDDIQLQCRYIRLASTALLPYNQTLNRIHAAVTYTQHNMSYRLIQAGVTSYRFELQDAITNTLPERVIGAFVSWKTFNGSLDTNAFWLEPKDLKRMTLSRSDGRKIIDIEANWLNNDWNEFYNFMLSEFNIQYTEDAMELLDYDSYAKGRHIFCVDTSRNHNADGHDSVPVNAKMEMSLEFNRPTVEDIVIILMYCDTKGIAIDGNRDVTLMIG